MLTDLTIVDLLVLAFSSFGITYIFRYTKGPWNVFEKVRWFFGMPFLDDKGKEVNRAEESNETFFADLIYCFWCTGTWVSFAVVLMYYVFPSVFPLFVWFAVVGIAGAVHDCLER